MTASARPSISSTRRDTTSLDSRTRWAGATSITCARESRSRRSSNPISFNYHSWWLASAADGLYSASGALLVLACSGGAANTHVGQEIDLQVTRAITPQLQLAGGYAYIISGAFLKEATPGASYSYPYVMATYVSSRSDMNTRRAFIKSAATTAGVLMSGLPKGWVGGVYADDGPETKTIRFGIIALTDCAPIVMAHELGYFKKFGIESVISKEASWAVIRDKLSLGENQATHMLIGMPLASTMGLPGRR